MSVRVPDTIVLLVCLVALTGAGAAADTLTERVAGVEAALSAGDGEAALEQMRELHHMVAARAGFGVRQTVLTEERATGFGIYTPRAQPVYASGSPVYGYVEPFGYSLQPDGQGRNVVVFDVEFALMDMDGQQLTGRIQMGTIEMVSHSRPLDAFFHLTYTINAPDGDYVIWTRVVDRPSGQEAAFTLPVTFRTAPAPQRK